MYHYFQGMLQIAEANQNPPKNWKPIILYSEWYHSKLCMAPNNKMLTSVRIQRKQYIRKIQEPIGWKPHLPWLFAVSPITDAVQANIELNLSVYTQVAVVNNQY